jgi:hypothetical protein
MVLIQLLLPTVGSGRTGGSTRLAQTHRELVDRFDGLTAYVRSPAKGLWTAPDGRREQDDMVMVEVVTDHFDRQWWRQYAATLADRFGQDTIHVRAMAIQLVDEPGEDIGEADERTAP